MENLKESLIARIWQCQLLDRSRLVTEDGEPISVIYPGRINDDRGADFRDAVISTRHGLRKGDVEVHIKSSDWRAHRHHRDSNYNRVILHVVMWHDSGVTTHLQSGGETSVLALRKYIKTPYNQWNNLAGTPASSSLPCHRAVERLETSIITEFLDNGGEERFLTKADKFQTDLAQMTPSQSLYQGIMGALGYAKNKLPCLELARRLPLQALEALNQDRLSDEDYLARQQAWLLGTAGLLPSQCPDWYRWGVSDDRWAERLENLWVSSRHGEVMSVNDWHLFKVRPNNFPVRRLVAMSYLALSYREQGIFEGVVNKIKEAPINKGNRELEKALLITTNGYWASHWALGCNCRMGIPTLLGSRRAADIVVNVLLPFTFAWSRFTSQPELARKAFELYCHYPRLEVNTVERHMSHQLGLNSDLVSSAQRQQGLIHIYNTLCSQGDCQRCPFGG